MKHKPDTMPQPRWAGLRWLRSYMVVILVIAAVFVSYSLAIIWQIRQDADSNGNRFAAYYQTAIEKSLKSLQDYSTTLLYNESAKAMHGYDTESVLSPSALDAGYDLVYSIRNFIMANGMLEDIYVYYPDADCVVGSNGVYSSYVYYKTENHTVEPQQTQYETWLYTLFYRTGNGFFVAEDEAGQNNVYYYHCVLHGGQGENRRIFVAKIGGAMLGASFEELVQSANYRFVALVDADSVIYASAGEQEAFVDEAGLFQQENASQQQIVYMANSALWPLKFVSVQDYGTAYHTVLLISAIILAGTALALTLGIGLSMYYARKDKAAVDKLAARFDGHGSDQQQRDLSYIGRQIDMLVEANQDAMRTSQEQLKTIKSFFLQELLKKQDCTEKDIDILSAMYGLNLENAIFSLVIARSAKGDAPLDRQQIDAFLNLATNDEYDDDFVVYWTQVDALEVFLCNYENRTKSQQGPVLMFAKAMRDYCGCEIQISPVMNAPTEIPGVWSQMYAPYCGKQPEQKPAARTILSALRSFNDAVDQDDLTSAIALVPELDRDFLSNANDKLALCRKYMLTAKLYEAYESNTARRKIDTLLLAVGEKDWTRRLVETLQQIDQDINRKVDMRQVAEIAHDMIHAEYRNPQLGLHMIADHIGVSQSYLSRLFKNKYGVSVIQYLNRVRIEEAKRLMLAGSDNLKVIAANVGYLSDVTLIRVFKKYEDTTPGNFRSRE